MLTTVPNRSPRKLRTARALREQAIAAAPVLRLVPDVEDASPEDVPRLGIGWREREAAMIADGHSLDEIDSLRTYAQGVLVASGWVSADLFTPYDATGATGGDAA